MALWAKAQELPRATLEQVHRIYGDHFPIEVRHFLAHWIEDKPWNEIDVDNQHHELHANGLLASLIQELENKINIIGNSQDMFITRLKLIEATRKFKELYAQNYHTLFKTIQTCMLQERRILEINTMGSSLVNNMPLYNQNSVNIMQDLERLKSKTASTSQTLHSMEQQQESFTLSFHELTKINSHIEYLKSAPPTEKSLSTIKAFEAQKPTLEGVLQQKIGGLFERRIELVKSLKETCAYLEATQDKILNIELINWKREQQLQGNGAKYISNLDIIQGFCESLAELIWVTRQHIKEAERLKNLTSKYTDPPNLKDELPFLNDHITQCLSHLVTSTFIIEKQPPQVMKTNTRFSATVRLLTGSNLNVYMTPPQVKAQIICENQANALLKNEKVGKNDASGEILNNQGVMEYQLPSKTLSISLRNMQLKKIKRAEKRGTESVMDEKFSLYFSSEFSIGGGELFFRVWTLSLPVVVIVHGNQEPHAHATITWDNAFAEPGRCPFHVPEKRPWPMIAEVLMMKFESATGRSLNAESLNFLAEKAFRAQYNDYTNMHLSWSQFCKEVLPERTFTFWEWFYAVMKLTREHLKNVWTDGLIMGFVRKKQTEELLSTQTKGTFLLRFSDSELGGITIAWVGDNMEVFMLQPFTGKDFQIRNLVDRINDLSHLTTLYPDIPKDKAFGQYYTPVKETLPGVNGYVLPFLVTRVPGFNDSNGMPIGLNSYPSTPQNMFHAHSPLDHTRDTPSVVSADSNFQNSCDANGLDYDFLNLPDVQLSGDEIEYKVLDTLSSIQNHRNQ